jgi:hypothetical protein
MYIIQFWHGSHAEWRGAGEQPFNSVDAARTRIRALREQSHGCVDFRVERVIAP